MARYIYAAYNAAPPDLADRPDDERDWYGLLRGEPLIGGLELSFRGGLHPGGVPLLAPLLDPAWRNVVTAIPGTIAGVAADAAYGLASTDPAGRTAALVDARALRDDVAALCDHHGEHAVIAVELHSAPVARPGASSVDHLAESLVEIAGWDWGGVALLLEHADALVPGHPPQKGWMPLEHEIAATRAASAATGRRIGHSINWGRSAIETGSADGVETHVARLRDEGLLDGLMISGASPQPTARSGAWEDVHLAIADVEPESLLTRAALASALRTVGANPLAVLGVKVGRAAHAATLPDRLTPGLATLAALHAAAERSAAA